MVARAAAAEKTSIDFEALDAQMQDQTVVQILDQALEMYGDDLAIAFSGAEDVALIQYASMTGKKFRVFSLDTGRLNPETYQLFDEVEKHFDIKIEFTFPDEKAVTDLVNEKGMFSFFEDGHKECCGVRKVQPLRRKLKTLKAWVTGQRKDSPRARAWRSPRCRWTPCSRASRAAPARSSSSTRSRTRRQEVWDFLRVMGTPVNKLHEMGYVSIGCAPCTRPGPPGQQEREGRWWWEDSAMKECGLHSGNITEEQKAKQDAREATEEDIFVDGAVAASDPRRDGGAQRRGRRTTRPPSRCSTRRGARSARRCRTASRRGGKPRAQGRQGDQVPSRRRSEGVVQGKPSPSPRSPPILLFPKGRRATSSSGARAATRTRSNLRQSIVGPL